MTRQSRQTKTRSHCSPYRTTKPSQKIPLKMEARPPNAIFPPRMYSDDFESRPLAGPPAPFGLAPASVGKGNSLTLPPLQHRPVRTHTPALTANTRSPVLSVSEDFAAAGERPGTPALDRQARFPYPTGGVLQTTLSVPPASSPGFSVAYPPSPPRSVSDLSEKQDALDSATRLRRPPAREAIGYEERSAQIWAASTLVFLRHQNDPRPPSPDSDEDSQSASFFDSPYRAPGPMRRRKLASKGFAGATTAGHRSASPLAPQPARGRPMFLNK